MSSSGSGSGSGGRRGSNESHSSGESAPNLGQRSPPQPPPPPPQNPGQNRPPKNPSAGQRSQPPPPQNPPQTLPKNPPPPQKPAPPNETYALTHSSWKPPPVAGPSDHGINYGGSGAQNKYGYGAYKEKHQHYSRDYSNIRHNPSAVGQDQFMYHCDQHATAEYNYPPNLDCGGSAPSSSEEVRDLYCCQPEAVSKACSNDPNCHMFKDTCRPGNFADSFPNRFKLPKGGRPSWLVHCGKILRFFAFYQEPIPESMIENYRIHQCEIRYFLDDGTIEVIEPKTFDPGFPQGRIIRRHKIPYPRPAHNATYSLEDLDVGCQVTFYGKTFFISGVDDATRVHLNRKEGRQVLANLEMPEDLYTNWRKDRIFSLFSRKGSINLESEKAKKFIANTGKVLRFWAYWDNRCEYGGELKKYIFHYFLQDDTVEIKEIVDPEGGVRGAITFLGKGKLLKDHKDLVPTVGIREDALLILNTVGGGNSCKHAIAPSYMTDSLCPGIDEKDFVTDKDLAIGAVINVYGRLFTLVDCDKATQTYYREKYGIDDFTPLVLEKSETERASPRVQVPPHIGIGTEADTLHNWDKLEPVPPPKQENLPEFRAKDKDVLCFEAQFYNAQHNANADRRFIIKIFMMDNKMQIFEKPHPNTGFKQGQFLARSMIRKRGHGLRPAFELGEESEYYEMKDYFIGNVLDINGFTFLLTGADEFTLSYMEANSSVFPQANFCLIIDKVREAFGPLESESVLQLFSCKDSQLNGIISRDDFRSILVTLMKQSLNEHEITTLLRGLKVDPPKVGIDFKTLQSVIQTELQRYHFDHFLLARVEYTFRYHDPCPCRFGHVDKETARATLKGARLPLDRLLVDYLIDNFTCVDDCSRLNYCALLHYLDWVHNGVPTASPAHISCVMKWLEPSPPFRKSGSCINYGAFLSLVAPSFRCNLASICSPRPDPPCQSEPSTSFSWPPPCETDTYFAQRERAGRVIHDARIRSEELRCKDEDLSLYCDDDAQNVRWRNSDAMSPQLVDAYLPPRDSLDEEYTPDCDIGPGGDKQYYKIGDHIGFEDLHPNI